MQVCPTGIDIRDGLQIECIACAACIDACDSVMDKMDYPRGLIRYTTENVLAGTARRILRPRTIVYATLLLALLARASRWGVTHRASLIVELLHDRNALYRERPDGGIENGYTVKLVNKTDRAHRARDRRIDDPGLVDRRQDTRSRSQPARSTSVPLTLRARRAAVHGPARRRRSSSQRR